MGKESMFGKVVEQTKGLVTVMVGEDELDIYDKDPGEKAKMLQKTSSVQCF